MSGLCASGTMLEIGGLRFQSRSLLVALYLAAPSPHAICIAASDFHRSYVAIFIAGCDLCSQTAIPIASLCDFHRKPFGFPSQAAMITETQKQTQTHTHTYTYTSTYTHTKHTYTYTSVIAVCSVHPSSNFLIPFESLLYPSRCFSHKMMYIQ